MDRKEYNQCLANRMRGLKVTPQERREAFCVSAKVCSKGISEEEALQQCKVSMSQPKQPKLRSKRRGGKTGEKELLELAHCIAENIDINLASNINSVETAIANALMSCRGGNG